MRLLHLAANEPGAVAVGIGSGDFLRIIRDLRRVHSHIAALAYPVLERAAEAGDRNTDVKSVVVIERAAEEARVAASGDRQ
jgi:hypothetical protein